MAIAVKVAFLGAYSRDNRGGSIVYAGTTRKCKHLVVIGRWGTPGNVAEVVEHIVVQLTNSVNMPVLARRTANPGRNSKL